MFEIFRKLSAQKAPTAADLRAALSSIDEAALDAAINAAEVARREALLLGDDRSVDATEARLAAARRDRDRAQAAREELLSRIDKAEKAERKAEIEAERARLDRLAKTIAADIDKIFPRAKAEILDLIDRINIAEREISAFNTKNAIEMASEGLCHLPAPNVAPIRGRTEYCVDTIIAGVLRE